VPSLVNLGLLLLRDSRREEAVPLLEAALALDPNLPAIRGRVGVALCGLAQYSASIPFLEAAVAENADDADFVNAYSLVLHTIGETGRAIDLLKRLLTRVPSASRAHSNLLMLMHFAYECTPEDIYADPDPERCLRVGLVTPHVVAGPVPSVLLSLIERHDRARLEFVMYANSSATDAITAPAAGRDHALAPDRQRGRRRLRGRGSRRPN
jgi:protein O-GlcNAc transferase